MAQEQAESAPAEPNGKAEDKPSSKGKPEPEVAQDGTEKPKKSKKSQATAAGKEDAKNADTEQAAKPDDAGKPKTGDAKGASSEQDTAAPKNGEVKQSASTATDAAPKQASEDGSTDKQAQSDAEPAAGEGIAVQRAEDAIEAAVQRATREGMPPEIVELSREVASFEGVVAEYRGDVRRLVAAQFKRRRAGIQGRYERIISVLSKLERERRVAAIKEFEKFVAKYPNNDKYTPDAIFRLAELHFERSADEFLVATEKYDDAMADFDEGKIKTEPTPPGKDFSKSIALFERLLLTWPDYERADGALYLKGFCLAEMGRSVPARDAFLNLVKKYPKSQFTPEAWTRLGEHYFDANDLASAISAYKEVLKFKKHRLYDEALYKLAWTYFRDDQYDRAINGFRELVEWSDAQSESTGQAGSELRAEAILYIANSLQEEDWDGDGEPDPGSGFTRVVTYVSGDKPYDVEILREIAEIFFRNAKYEEAIATVQHLLKKFPFNPENPTLHSKMVRAYDNLRRFDEAFRERDRLATNYGPGSEWYRKNQDDAEALSKADELMQDSLIQATEYHHSKAIKLRQDFIDGDANAETLAMAEYGLAAEAYEKYLARFPKSENAYLMNFRYAECLFYSRRFPRAATQYAQVRDSKLGTKYQEPSAFFAILSQTEAVKDLVQSGKVGAKPSLTGQPPAEPADTEEVEETDNDGLVKKIEAEPIPEEVDELITARVKYYELELTSTEDKSRRPRNIYKIGEVYFDYKQYEKARKWFSMLIDSFPKEKVTVAAANLIVESYREANDWKKMAEWAEKIAAAGLGRQFDEQIRTLKVGALFKDAERLQRAGKLKRAAKEYIRLVDENPGNRFAANALNNAAVAYETLRMFESATRTYERVYTEYPKSPFVEDALFRVGINSERFYDFQKAIDTHLKLVSQFPNSVNRADSLYKAAVLQERTKQYLLAAANFERYASLFPNRQDTAETYFRAGDTYRKLNDRKNELRVYDRFVREYGTGPQQNALTVEALTRIAKIYESNRRQRQANQGWQRVIEEFNGRGMQPATYEANYPAEATFRLIERDYKAYQRMKISGSMKNAGRVIKELTRRLKDLERRYNQVLRYRSDKWSIAALYRIGRLYQLFAEDLYDAPVPETLTDEEQDVYRTMLEDQAIPIEDNAVKKFEFAIGKAREYKIVNEWTKRILASLNKFKPSEYPLFKEELTVETRRQLTTPRMLNLNRPAAEDEGTESQPPEAPKTGEKVTPEASGNSSDAESSSATEGPSAPASAVSSGSDDSTAEDSAVNDGEPRGEADE